MILVDSSAWIQVLRGLQHNEFAAATATEEVVSCLPVMQEVLQGIDNEAAYRIAIAAFADIRFLESPLTKSVFDEAVALFRDARRAGVTVRSSVDCLIAACAIRNDATVLHRDRDYSNLARITPLRAKRL
jgi:predicted nucleic acid-binding protein